MNGLLIERGLGEADLALKGVGLGRGGEELSGAVEAEVVGACEDEHVFWLLCAEGAGLVWILIHTVLFKLYVWLLCM